MAPKKASAESATQLLASSPFIIGTALISVNDVLGSNIENSHGTESRFQRLVIKGNLISWGDAPG